MRKVFGYLVAVGLVTGFALVSCLGIYETGRQNAVMVGEVGEEADYIGGYVDDFTLLHGSDRGKRIEIENISDGCIWATLYYHDYGSVGTTVKGRLEGAKIENGLASGTYRIAWNDFSDETGNDGKILYGAGTFQIKLKDSAEFLYDTFNEGSEGEANAFSPIAFRYDNGTFEDFYFFEQEWEGNIANWFMESEEDLF